MPVEWVARSFTLPRQLSRLHQDFLQGSMSTAPLSSELFTFPFSGDGFFSPLPLRGFGDIPGIVSLLSSKSPVRKVTDLNRLFVQAGHLGEIVSLLLEHIPQLNAPHFVDDIASWMRGLRSVQYVVVDITTPSSSPLQPLRPLRHATQRIPRVGFLPRSSHLLSSVPPFSEVLSRQ